MLNRLFYLNLFFCVVLSACQSSSDSSGDPSGGAVAPGSGALPSSLPTSTPSPLRGFPEDPNPTERPIEQPIEQPTEQPTEQPAVPVSPLLPTPPVSTSLVSPSEPLVLSSQDLTQNFEDFEEEDRAFLAAGPTTEQIATLSPARMDRLLRHPNFPLNALSPEQIERLTDNQKGLLIDRPGLLIYHPERLRDRYTLLLSPEQMRALAPQGNVPHFETPFFHQFYVDAGYCSLRVLNFFIGRPDYFETAEFEEYVNQLYNEHPILAGQSFNATWGLDLQIMRNFLERLGTNLINADQHPPTIGELPGFVTDKTAAIEAYVGQARRLIVAVNRAVPLPGQSFWGSIIQEGHYVAMRKDLNDRWWLLDPSARAPVNIPLAILHESLVLLVPAGD